MNWVLPIVVVLGLLNLWQVWQAPQVALGPDGQAPDFFLTDTRGDKVQLSALKGSKVVVNFWGTWCGPCKAEIPGLNRFARTHPDVTVLGVALDSGDPKTLAAAKEQLGIEFRVLEGTSEVKQQWGVRTVPSTFYIDPQGVLMESHVGVITPIQLGLWVR